MSVRWPTKEEIANVTGRLQAGMSTVGDARRAIMTIGCPVPRELAERLSEAEASLLLAINQVQRLPADIAPVDPAGPA